MKLIAFLVMTLATVAIAQNNSVYRVRNKYYNRIRNRVNHLHISYDEIADAESIAQTAWRNMQICVNEYMTMRDGREYKSCLRSYVRTALKQLRVLEANHIRDYHSNGNGYRGYNHGQYHPTMWAASPGVQVAHMNPVPTFPTSNSTVKPPENNTSNLSESDEDDDDLSSDLE